MRDAGLPMAFGSDLLGGLRKYHCMEFELLAKVLTPADIIRSATRQGTWACCCQECVALQVGMKLGYNLARPQITSL